MNPTDPSSETGPSPTELAACTTQIAAVRAQVNRVLVGQAALLDRLLVGLLTGGHILLEGVPGLAKTTVVKALAAAMQGSFRRIQFTPDMLPSDITGNLIYNPSETQYRTKLGPIFANLVLADEINRAPAKVQSALLEAMQEGQVTIGDHAHALPQPFLVLATENPIEHEGTYPLPEAQVDRFMMKVEIGYPTEEEELAILERMGTTRPALAVDAVLQPADILRLRVLVDRVRASMELRRYIVNVVLATRGGEGAPATLQGLIRLGASPRATINMLLAAKAHALLRGSTFAIPDDVKAVAPAVLCHRIVPTFEADAEGISANELVRRVLASVATP
jgi:MoxR-like ATPase